MANASRQARVTSRRAASACSSASPHAGGPPLSIYLLPLRLEKTVLVGTTVTWKNEDSINHTATSDGEAAIARAATLAAREDERESGREARALLGEQPADMIGVLVEDVIRHSRGEPRVVQGEACAEAMSAMRAFMFEHVYLRPEAQRQTERATRLLTDLYGHYLEHPDAMPMGASLAGDPVAQQAVDAIAGMTDRYALAAWKAAFAPEAV